MNGTKTRKSILRMMGSRNTSPKKLKLRKKKSQKKKKK